jgi:hypothetical protein
MGLGTELRFTRDDDLSWSPQIAQSRDATRFPELDPTFQMYVRPDPRLLNVWADLRAFSKLVNDATARRSKVSAEIAMRLATSVPHRLERLGREAEARVSTAHQYRHVPVTSVHDSLSLHELLRLCMLAYAKMLLMKLPGIGRKMTFLADGLRNVLTAWHADLELRQACGDVSGDVMGVWKLVLWGAFVAGVSIFEDFDEEWLRELLVQGLSVLGLRSWAEAREELKGFLWIDVVFDQPGKRSFHQCCVI